MKYEVDQNTPVKYETAIRLGDHIAYVHFIFILSIFVCFRDTHFLTEKLEWKGDVADTVNVASVLENDNPLRYFPHLYNSSLIQYILSFATHVSEKELIRAQLVALRKHSFKLQVSYSLEEYTSLIFLANARS